MSDACGRERESERCLILSKVVAVNDFSRYSAFGGSSGLETLAAHTVAVLNAVTTIYRTFPRSVQKWCALEGSTQSWAPPPMKSQNSCILVEELCRCWVEAVRWRGAGNAFLCFHKVQHHRLDPSPILSRSGSWLVFVVRLLLGWQSQEYAQTGGPGRPAHFSGRRPLAVALPKQCGGDSSL